LADKVEFSFHHRHHSFHKKELILANPIKEKVVYQIYDVFLSGWMEVKY